MAKYEYDYACGHGSTVVSLFGKTADRERKLEWYRNNAVCPECYKAQKAKEAKEMGLVFSARARRITTTDIILAFTGDTAPVKEKIKELGYTWGTLPSSGLFGFLSLSPEKKRGIKISTTVKSRLKQLPLRPLDSK